MAYFPVTSSILSGTHLSQLLQQLYDLSTNTTCTIIRSGINDTYRVNDGQSKFVLRVYSLNWRTVDEIAEELRLLMALQSGGLSVSYPVADKMNSLIQTLDAPEGKRYAVLFSFAEGDKIHSFSADIHYTIGKMMGNFHQLTHNQSINRIHYTAGELLEKPFPFISAFLPPTTPEMKYMAALQQSLLNELKTADTKALRNGVIHLDIWFDNLNISNDGEVTLFDFDFCGNGWQATDIAYYIMQLANTEKYIETAYKPKTEQFIAGYESVIRLSNEEKRLLPYLGVSLYFFYLGVQCRRYDNWSNSFLNADYLKRFINGLVKRYAEMNGIKI
jgi:Ser/Thr protein kinase RdoA (MazF antagonist)